MMNEIFSQRLKKAMRGKTQMQVAAGTGISQQTLSRYLRGVNTPDIDRLMSLCQYLQCSADYFLGLMDEDGKHRYPVNPRNV